MALHAGIMKAAIRLTQAADDTIAVTATEIVSVAARRVDLTGALPGSTTSWTFVTCVLSCVLPDVAAITSGEIFTTRYLARERSSHGDNTVARARLRESATRTYLTIAAPVFPLLAGLIGSNDHRRIILGIEGIAGMCSLVTNKGLISNRLPNATLVRLCELISVS